MTRQETAGALADSVEVRERLVEALNLDLIGPWGGHTLAAERLPGWVRPSNWYLTGFLIPSGTKPELSADADEEDDIDETPESGGLAEESSEERRAAKKGFFPSSMGLSFLVAAEADALAVIVRWGDYQPGRVEGADGKSASAWLRQSNERTVPVSLSGAGEHRRGDLVVPDSGGLTLHVDERPIRTDGLAEIPAGTRSVSVFLVNGRAPDDDNPDRAYAFQAEIEVRGRQPFVPRPDPRGVQAADWDDQVADLHYADTPEYATGHGVSADWEVVERACRMLRTAWIPAADVEETKTAPVPGAELSMDKLGALADGQTAGVALRPLVRAVSRLDRIAARGDRNAAGCASRDRRRVAAAGRHRSGPHGTRNRHAGRGRGRARRLPRGEPRRRARSPPAVRRAVHLAAACLAPLSTRFRPAQPPRTGRPARSRPRDRGSALLPDRRRQDGSVSRSRGARDGAAKTAEPRTGWSPRCRRERHHAVHVASAHAGSARPRVRSGVRAGAGARSRHREIRQVAVRDRPLGRQGGDAEFHGPER